MLTIAPPSVCSASHLSSKGQGTQISHSAHHLQECLIPESAALHILKRAGNVNCHALVFIYSLKKKKIYSLCPDD